jgi:hypothetical protein
MKFFTTILILIATSPMSYASEEICIDGGMKLATTATSISVTVPLDGRDQTFEISSQKILGRDHGNNALNILGFYTIEKMKELYCKGTIKDTAAIFTPELTPLNSYWYLKDWQDQESQVNKLVLFTGRVNRNGVCEELLEGHKWIQVDCQD